MGNIFNGWKKDGCLWDVSSSCEDGCRNGVQCRFLTTRFVTNNIINAKDIERKHQDDPKIKCVTGTTLTMRNNWLDDSIAEFSEANTFEECKQMFCIS